MSSTETADVLSRVLTIAGLAAVVLGFAGWDLRGVAPGWMARGRQATARLVVDDSQVAELRRAFATVESTLPGTTLEPAVATPGASLRPFVLASRGETDEVARTRLNAATASVRGALRIGANDYILRADDETTPAPDDRTRRAATLLPIVVGACFVTGQVLLVIGGRRQGASTMTTLVLAAFALVVEVGAAFYGGHTGPYRSSYGRVHADAGLTVLLVATTIVTMTVVWLTAPKR